MSIWDQVKSGVEKGFDVSKDALRKASDVAKRFTERSLSELELFDLKKQHKDLTRELGLRIVAKSKEAANTVALDDHDHNLIARIKQLEAEIEARGDRGKGPEEKD